MNVDEENFDNEEPRLFFPNGIKLVIIENNEKESSSNENSEMPPKSDIESVKISQFKFACTWTTKTEIMKTII